MDSQDHVGRVLRRVLALSLGPVVAGTCASINTAGFTPAACQDDGTPQVLTGLRPVAGADYLELRGELREHGHTIRRAETSGTPCARATDPAACAAKIAASNPDSGFGMGDYPWRHGRHVLIVNAGDEVKVLRSKAEVKAWLGRVDSPGEAVLVSALEGYRVPCGGSEPGGVRSAGEGYEVLATRFRECPIERVRYVLRVDPDGNLSQVDAEILESSPACIGRRPAGLVPRGAGGATVVGAWFAHVAQLEAASVRAFEVLRRELARHGAPPSLIGQASAARRDEVRHARAVGELAARYGGRWRAPEVTPQPLRSLEELAVENAAEGCVRETFGALVGMWQARFAADRAVRRVMRGIARDETRHAQLAWAIDRWVRPRLSAVGRRRAAEARLSALGQLAAEAQRDDGDRDLVRCAGLPGPADARRLAAHFARSVEALARDAA